MSELLDELVIYNEKNGFDLIIKTDGVRLMLINSKGQTLCSSKYYEDISEYLLKM